MNEWMEHFISQCLAGVPWGRYRRRAEKELRDHMQSLRQSMTEAEVLQRMGDPEQLREEYQSAWKPSLLWRMGRTVVGVIVIWGLIFLSMCLAAQFPHPEPNGLFANGLASGTVLFLIPFSLGALFLRACFRRERRRTLWVTLGLLLSWISFNPLFVRMMITFREYDQYYEQTLWIPLLLARFPWMRPYLWTSFLGCLALGWLFGRKKKGSLA